MTCRAIRELENVTWESYESNHLNMTRLVVLTPDFIFNRNRTVPGFMVHCIDALRDPAKTVVIGNGDQSSGA
jgi:hypothetical protein